MTEIKDIENKIRRQFPEIEFKDESFNDCLFLTFKTNYQKDYYYFIELSKEFKYVNIGATLENQEKNQYFWLTRIDYKIRDVDNVEIFNEFMFETIEILVNHRTRIIQEKKMISQAFTLEYFIENDWKKLETTSAFKYGGFKFPAIEMKRKIYE
jgi:hypothetical protein